MADYESVRAAHAARMMASMPESYARLGWTREQIQAERRRGLRDLLAHARAHSPWHRARLGDVDVARFEEADLRRLPVMTKHDLMTHFDAIVTDPRLTRAVVERHLDGLAQDAYLLDEYHVCASGGSSGQRGVFVYEQDAWSVVFLSYFRFLARRTQEAFGGASLRVAMVAADKASHMTSAIGATFRPRSPDDTQVPATWPLARIVAELNTFQPNVVQGYTSMVHQLTHEAAAGRLRIAPRLVAVTSEPLLPEIRAAVARVWGVPLFNGFGSTEGLMGGSCSGERGLHLSDDLFVLEPVDADGAPVPAGTRAAKVYLTRLYAGAQPLIRYELTDEMTVLDEPCPCGTSLLRIDDVQGRLDDCFAYAGGAIVHPFAFRSVLGREAAIVEYQVQQTPGGAAVLVCGDAGAIDTTSVADKLRAALATLGLADAEVTVTVVAGLERQATGKLRRFIAL
jgi:phenylacetate-coenzyme A ligase PaaK-like adenylate-forming protein